MENEKKLTEKEIIEAKARMKAELENRTFADRYELAAKNWVEVHGKKKLPTYQDPKTGKILWANRAMRRGNKK